jgi:lysozyme family protein
MMTWEQFFKWLMDHEGRIVHHDKDDPGGQTAWGISRRHNPGWPGWQLVDRGITSGAQFEGAVSSFYWGKYQPLWTSLPPRVREAVVDAVINMGPGRPGDDLLGGIELLQEALCRLAQSRYVTVDGIYGPETREAVKHADPSALAFAVCALRLADYGLRGRQGKVARKYLDGWINRVRSLMERI